MKKLLIATKNRNKLREISEIFADLNIDVVSAYDYLNVDDDVVEDGATFEDNAAKKALHLSLMSEEFVAADDSGIEVGYLSGKPGVFSARYAGDGCSDSDNNKKLLSEMYGLDDENRRCRFVCCIALAKSGKLIGTFFGYLNGMVGYIEKGSNGFGYDTIFLLENGLSLAEVSPEFKNSISHRREALEGLKRYMDCHQN